jgi:hypothetical protein
MLLRISIRRVAIALALTGLAESQVQAQNFTPRTVRIGNESAAVVTRPVFGADVINVVPAATELEVLLLDDGWYWVVLAPDTYGTRRAGWLRAGTVEGGSEPMPNKAGQKAPKPKKNKSLDKARLELEKARAEYEQAIKPSAATPEQR